MSNIEAVVRLRQDIEATLHHLPVKFYIGDIGTSAMLQLYLCLSAIVKYASAHNAAAIDTELDSTLRLLFASGVSAAEPGQCGQHFRKIYATMEESVITPNVLLGRSLMEFSVALRPHITEMSVSLAGTESLRYLMDSLQQIEAVIDVKSTRGMYIREADSSAFADVELELHHVVYESAFTALTPDIIVKTIQYHLAMISDYYGQSIYTLGQHSLSEIFYMRRS